MFWETRMFEKWSCQVVVLCLFIYQSEVHLFRLRDEVNVPPSQSSCRQVGNGVNQCSSRPSTCCDTTDWNIVNDTFMRLKLSPSDKSQVTLCLFTIQSVDISSSISFKVAIKHISILAILSTIEIFNGKVDQQNQLSWSYFESKFSWLVTFHWFYIEFHLKGPRWENGVTFVSEMTEFSPFTPGTHPHTNHLPRKLCTVLHPSNSDRISNTPDAWLSLDQ